MSYFSCIGIDLRRRGTGGTAVLVDDNKLYSASLGAWGVLTLKGNVEIRIDFEQYDREHHELVELIRAKKHRKVYNRGWKLVGEWLKKDHRKLQEVFDQLYQTGVRHGKESKTAEIQKALGLGRIY